jgi:hypothetical protein
VTFELVKYKRTDIPDGPLYQLLRSEVYISYRNQLKEILNIGGFIPPVTQKTDETKAEIKEEIKKTKGMPKDDLVKHQY